MEYPNTQFDKTEQSLLNFLIVPTMETLYAALVSMEAPEVRSLFGNRAAVASVGLDGPDRDNTRFQGGESVCR
jgi:hypothetical protein